MKTLITDDDFISRMLLQKLLMSYGEVHVAVNGKEAVQAVRAAIDSGEPYNLICLDIMMPEMDGHIALQQIRKAEEDHRILSSQGAKVIMATALGDMKNVNNAFQSLCDGYLVKPIDKTKLFETLRTFGF